MNMQEIMGDKDKYQNVKIKCILPDYPNKCY